MIEGTRHAADLGDSRFMVFGRRLGAPTVTPSPAHIPFAAGHEDAFVPQTTDVVTTVARPDHI
ncbi:MAG: hypothetical protein KJO84_05240 [Acidimicrobiia bacterium]|nr:hypothetical protein [Acidimicrobiia bacterium]